MSADKLGRVLLVVSCVTALLAVASCGAAKAPATTGKRYPVRGVYDRDFSRTGFDHEADLGFNLIDSGPNPKELRALVRRGLRGLVWLGGYSNDTCTFEQSDRWIRTHVKAVAGMPRRGSDSRHRSRRRSGVGAYFIDDEPDASACPTAPAQIKARSDLIKSIDPGPPTLMVDYKVDQFKLWAGKTDILGLDHYPCSIQNGCDYSKIDDQAAEADRLGIRYWGVLQAFGDDYYKLPTRQELHRQFIHWRATRMDGYLVFAWHWPENDSSFWLANHPELQSQLADENTH